MVAVIIHLLLFAPLLVYSALVNVTIDDTNGDSLTGALPVYNAPNEGNPWFSCTPKTCGAPSDVKQVFDQTWHYAHSIGPGGAGNSVTIEFTGVSIEVYFLIIGGKVLALDVQFDGSPTSGYFHDALKVAPDTPLSRQLVFSTDGLQNTKHQVVFALQDGWGFANSALFDFAIYVHDSGNSTNSRIPIIVGGAAGGAILIAVVAGIFIVRMCRRRKSPPVGDTDLFHDPLSEVTNVNSDRPVTWSSTTMPGYAYPEPSYSNSGISRTNNNFATSLYPITETWQSGMEHRMPVQPVFHNTVPRRDVNFVAPAGPRHSIVETSSSVTERDYLYQDTDGRVSVAPTSSSAVDSDETKRLRDEVYRLRAQNASLMNELTQGGTTVDTSVQSEVAQLRIRLDQLTTQIGEADEQPPTYSDR